MHRLFFSWRVTVSQKNAAKLTSARTLSSHRRPGSPPPELLAEENKSNLSGCK
jgi:hypothetical protein